MILVDSDILIQFSRHDDQAADWLDEVSKSSKLSIGVVSEMELIFGSRDKVHLKEVRRFLSKFEIIQIDENISSRASRLVEKYCLSHRLQLPDALIAATALEIDIKLATINRREAIRKLPENERQAGFAKMRENGEFLVPRLSLGKSRDDKASFISLNDAKGKERLKISVTADGNPRIDFLDATGKVIYSLPETKK